MIEDDVVDFVGTDNNSNPTFIHTSTINSPPQNSLRWRLMKLQQHTEKTSSVDGMMIRTLHMFQIQNAGLEQQLEQNNQHTQDSY